jgi:eukaryotic-like serine/threonine-protein kinase
MSIKNFDKDFLVHYKIESFFSPEKKGGQKVVLFPVINGVKQVMKIYEGGKDERFHREMEIYEKFKGLPGLPVISNIDEYHGETIVFEEYIEGDTLSDIISSYNGDGDRIRALLLGVCEIMAPIWRSNYVHRDLKPENIMIRADGSPVVLDFGIAKDLDGSSITATGLQPGTYRWASPEQYAGKKDMISYRTDFFSLGVIAYNLYHNTMPFGETVHAIDIKFRSGDESFPVDDSCPLKKYLKESMRFSVAQRPRLVEDLIALI